MTKLSAGAAMWLPCAVQPGAFSDERLVLVQVEGSEWFGFVQARWLKDRVSEGADEVLASVVDVRERTFRARIPGDSFRSSLIEGKLDCARLVAEGNEPAQRAY